MEYIWLLMILRMAHIRGYLYKFGPISQFKVPSTKVGQKTGCTSNTRDLYCQQINGNDVVEPSQGWLLPCLFLPREQGFATYDHGRIYIPEFACVFGYYLRPADIWDAACSCLIPAMDVMVHLVVSCGITTLKNAWTQFFVARNKHGRSQPWLGSTTCTVK